ncbi:MAG: 1-deoxy-D-xylulose-5-phosphate synthase [Bacilli bacterium]
MKIEDIKSPHILKDMNIDELNKLNSNIREFLIENVSKTGGHLSSNLGVVELTTILHKVFDSPNDQIFFDVGHQSYVHKILTGRAKDFHSLRQFQGLSGFIKNSESLHDVWESGHASTSLSGLLGYSQANKILGVDNKTIAVIGDGSIGGGMSFEALNHIGEIGENVIVVLNDNGMSITKPVGGLYASLSKIRLSQNYIGFKKKLKRIVRKVHGGHRILSYFKNVRTNLKKKFFEEGYFFEELGLKYYGPIDGHDSEQLIEIFEFVKNLKKPILVHVKTIKGKGYSFAENDTSGAWHGVSKFDVKTGEILKNKKFGYENWSNIIIWTIEELAKTNEDIVVLTPAMENGSMLENFKKKFPDRYFDVGIAEEHATTMCAGLALGGLHPVLSIYSTFLQRGYDQLIHDICRMNTRVVISVDRSGIVGADGETHHGIYDIAFLKTIPNLVICMPRNAEEAQHLLSTCIKYNGPIAIRYPRGSAEFNQVNAYKEFDIGVWEEVTYGNDAVIISYGPHVDELCMYINKHNYDIGVINARFISPIDYGMLQKIFKNYKNVYVYEEVVASNNLYSEIVKVAFEGNYDVNIESFCLPNSFIEHGDVKDILAKYELDYKTVFTKIIEVSNVK